MVNKRLVIALDNSKECLKALDFALEHFPIGYTYHLVHLQPRPVAYPYVASPLAFEISYLNMQAIDKETITSSSKFLDDVFASKAKSAGADVFAVVVSVDSDSSSDIGAAICTYTEKTKANALILMRQNKSTISRFFLGSVTKYCAIHSPVPVIIVPSTA
ncbi:g9424 [Coccomyxa elongata]